MGSLDGKVAIITGAGQGVGEGIALALWPRKAPPSSPADARRSTLLATCAKIEALGGQAMAVVPAMS